MDEEDLGEWMVATFQIGNILSFQYEDGIGNKSIRSGYVASDVKRSKAGDDYVQLYCFLRNSIRSFRVDRMMYVVIKGKIAPTGAVKEE